MTKYKIFIDVEVADQIRSIRGPRKEEIFRYLTLLGEEPFLEGDFHTVRDGRRIEVKVFGKLSLLFWADHPVKEIKVIELFHS